MAEKKIKLSIEGQEVVCNFGVNYFYKHFNEITGIDLFVEGLKDTATVKAFDMAAGIYCAGYFAECSFKKEEPKLSIQDFKHHVLSLDEAGAVKMVTDYTSLINVIEKKTSNRQPVIL